MALDSNGFPQPTGEFETIEADSLVLALGQDVDLGLLEGVPGLLVSGGVVQVAANMMTEAQNIGAKLGVLFKVSLEKRIAGAQAVGQHKTSMLQDVEAGRQLELQALVGAVIELGQITDTPTPTIKAVYALTSLLAKNLADHKATLSIS